VRVKSEVSRSDKATWSFEIGLPTKVFQAYLSNRPAVLGFQGTGAERQEISLCTPRVGNDKVKVLITEMNESEPLSKCRK
jgi:hypothetical protein